MKRTYTPQQLEEILRRVEQQLIHDAATDAVTFGEGLRHYALRQILHYADEVFKEDGRRRYEKKASS